MVLASIFVNRLSIEIAANSTIVSILALSKRARHFLGMKPWRKKRLRRPSTRNATYADMVSADRELRLAGYEVYRFGANMLVSDGAESTITGFFEKLFRLHRVGR